MTELNISEQPIAGSFRKQIGESLKAFREQKNLSQDQLATLMKVSRSTISKIENGRFAISVDYLERLSQFLDFEINFSHSKK